MPEEIDHKTAQARQQIELLESEKKQITQRRLKDEARLGIIEVQITALQPLVAPTAQ